MAKKPKLPPRQQYSLSFTEQQWEEIESCSFTGFAIATGKPMWRDQWMAVGHMLMGKASRLRLGEYDGEPDDKWANELDAIADVVFEHFQPGDGRI